MSVTLLKHVDYPHVAGYLFDCAACEARCHCASPTQTECVYDGDHTQWTLRNRHVEHANQAEVWRAVRSGSLTLAVAQTIASWWQSPGSVGHVLASLASGYPSVDIRELVDDIDRTFALIRRNPDAYLPNNRDLHALREWVIAQV